LKDEVGHKAIIMIASGDDKGSKVKLDEAMVAAEKADAAVYAIRYVDADLSGTSYARLKQQTTMRNIVDGTGGRTLNPAKPDSVTKTVRDIAEELRGQYSIGFTPAKLDGSVHKIEVRVSQHGLRALCRKAAPAKCDPAAPTRRNCGSRPNEPSRPVCVPVPGAARFVVRVPVAPN
jgi:VWFA-related protein